MSRVLVLELESQWYYRHSDYYNDGTEDSRSPQGTLGFMMMREVSSGVSYGYFIAFHRLSQNSSSIIVSFINQAIEHYCTLKPVILMLT